MSSDPVEPVLPDEMNPNAAPETGLSPGAEGQKPLGDTEAIRRRYSRQEANVRSIGLLYYLSAGILLVIAIGAILIGLIGLHEPRNEWWGLNPILIAFGIAAGPMGLFNAILGVGLRKLRNWARWLTMIEISLGIVAIGLWMLGSHIHPRDFSLLGTLWLLGMLLILISILVLLALPKNRVVFSPAYREVVAQTPEIRAGMSPLMKLLLILTGVVVLIGFLTTQ